MAYFPWCKLISTWKDLHYILTFKRGIVVIVQLNAFSLLFIKIICGFFAGKSENFENSVRLHQLVFRGGGGPVTGGSKKVST